MIYDIRFSSSLNCPVSLKSQCKLICHSNESILFNFVVVTAATSLDRHLQCALCVATCISSKSNTEEILRRSVLPHYMKLLNFLQLVFCFSFSSCDFRREGWGAERILFYSFSHGRYLYKSALLDTKKSREIRNNFGND